MHVQEFEFGWYLDLVEAWGKGCVAFVVVDDCCFSLLLIVPQGKQKVDLFHHMNAQNKVGWWQWAGALVAVGVPDLLKSALMR